MTSELEHVRRIALALPEVTERVSHHAPCFYVRGRRAFCRVHVGRGPEERTVLWCTAPPGVPEELTSTAPERFFRPTPSASGVFAGWLGMVLHGFTAEEDWAEVAAVLRDAYRAVAPRTLVAELDGPLEPGPGPV